MASDTNSITISGNMTRDPEMRYTPSGVSKVSFGVAVNRSWRNQQTQEWDEQTSFFNVVAWRQLAENVGASLAKGSRVVVTGRLEQRSWETEQGEKRSIVEIVADDVSASLRFATAEVHKVERSGPSDGGGGGGARARLRSPRRPAAATSQLRPVRRRAVLTPYRSREGNELPQRREKKGPSAKDRRPIKKKTSILNTESVKWIDYKDVNLLRRFMSERAKIRARRVTGNDQQQQAAVAKAIKLAREMALLPYSVRQVTQRSKGRRDRGDRGDRGELRLPSSVPTSQSSSPAAPTRSTRRSSSSTARPASWSCADLDGAGELDTDDLGRGRSRPRPMPMRRTSE